MRFVRLSILADTKNKTKQCHDRRTHKKGYKRKVLQSFYISVYQETNKQQQQQQYQTKKKKK